MKEIMHASEQECIEAAEKDYLSRTTLAQFIQCTDTPRFVCGYIIFDPQDSEDANTNIHKYLAEDNSNSGTITEASTFTEFKDFVSKIILDGHGYYQCDDPKRLMAGVIDRTTKDICYIHIKKGIKDSDLTEFNNIREKMPKFECSKKMFHGDIPVRLRFHVDG